MTKYRVAKTPPFTYQEARQQDYELPYIEFDSKEQYEHISMTSNAYKMLQAKYDFLFDCLVKMMETVELCKTALLTDGRIKQRFKDEEEEE